MESSVMVMRKQNTIVKNDLPAGLD